MASLIRSLSSVRSAYVVALLAIALTACAVEVGEEDEDSESGDLPPELVETIVQDDTTTIAAGSRNRVGNPGFEAAIKTGAHEAYENWVATSEYVRRDNRTVWEGAYSLVVIGNPAKLTTAYQLIRADGNARYKIEAMVKAFTLGPRRQRIYVMFFDLFGRKLGTKSIPIFWNNGKWHKKSMEAITPGGTWFMGIALGKDWTCASGCSAGGVHYDSVHVVKL